MLRVIVCLQLFAQLLADPVPEQELWHNRCPEQDLFITVDNKLEVYIDGKPVTGLPNADNWQVADRVRVPASARVIAVKGEDVGVVAGILASGKYFQTDGTWRCSNKAALGWKEVLFIDAFWSPATVIGKHGVSPWGKISGISDDASWIWTSKNQYGPDSDKVVYCRARLPDCKPDVPDVPVCSGTGSSCVKSCVGLPSGNYQSCDTCNGYIACSNEYLYNMPCAPATPPLVWDDTVGVKRCEYNSPTCALC